MASIFLNMKKQATASNTRLAKLTVRGMSALTVMN